MHETLTDLSPQLMEMIIDGVLKEAGGELIEVLEYERDAMLMRLLATRLTD